MLDKNALTICYNPASPAPDRLLASRSGPTKLRAQDSPLPPADTKRISMPAPEMVGVRAPEIALAGAKQRVGWRSTRAAQRESETQPKANDGSEPLETEMQMEPAPGSAQQPEPISDSVEPISPPKPQGKGGWKAVKPLSAAASEGDR
jgi:hypothetical protein